MNRGYHPDAWLNLLPRTPARIAIGRAGGSLPTAEVLKFAFDHAEARDAVHETLDVEAAEAGLRWLGLDVVQVESMAADGRTYLLRPDYGRRLSADSASALQAGRSGPFDVVLILADGLSATAANRHGVALVKELVPKLVNYQVGPIVIARRARVAIEDEIGQALNARCAVILLGERPGLGTADSLGAYLVFDPRHGKTDADRNCVSNIRPAGLPLAAAAETLAFLINASLQGRMSGVHLKDDRPRTLL